jgi:hypothetical protein
MYYKDYKLNVTNVECRVYGYSKDGATIQVCGADHNFVTDPSGAKGSSSWVTLTRGKIKENQSIGVYDTDFSTKWEDSKEGDYWSTYSANSDNSFFVSPVNATKFIQYKITGTIGGKENSSRSNVRAADLTVGETIVNYIPDFFCTERPASTTDSNDEELSQYMYVLTGQNKIVSVSSGIETGIEEILDEEEAQEAVEGVEVETIYYNLQGQRVKNPDHGIYIRVHGNKVTKVAL